jgi:hypothetical protein
MCWILHEWTGVPCVRELLWQGKSKHSEGNLILYIFRATVLLYYIILYCYVMLCCVVLCCVVLYYIILYYIILYYIILYYIILYYIIRRCMYSSHVVRYGRIIIANSGNRTDMQRARVLCMCSAEFIWVKVGDGVTTVILSVKIAPSTAATVYQSILGLSRFTFTSMTVPSM